MNDKINIEGVSIDELKSMPPDDIDGLLAFGKPIVFNMGSASILAEFNREGDHLSVNLGHIDGGGEGVLVVLWKLIETYAKERGYTAITWKIHALTCANPNPRLQQFLRNRGFEEVEDEEHGRLLQRKLNI